MDNENRLTAVEHDIKWMRRNLKLQANEYNRRLDGLNHAHEQARDKEKEYVTQEKYDDYVKNQADTLTTQLGSEKEAREHALERVDEKFQEYVKRYEIRQREIDQTLATQKGAAEQSRRQIEEQARKTNRNIGLMGVAVAFVVFLANYSHLIHA